MKKTFGLLSLLTLSIWVSFGWELIPSTTPALENNCNGGTFSQSFYVGKTPAQTFGDVLKRDANNNDILRVIFDNSAVSLYNPYGALSLQNGGWFALKSQIKPAGVDAVLAFSQNPWTGTLITNHGPQRDGVAAQWVFQIARKTKSGTSNNSTKYQYLNIWEVVPSFTTSNATFGSTIFTDKECINIYVGRCGDGILDDGTAVDNSGWALYFDGKSTSNGELAGGENCDEGPLNGTPGHCNKDCYGYGNAPFCGDKIVNNNEQCDEGTLVNWTPGHCTSTCTSPTVGTLKLTKTLLGDRKSVV